MTGQILWDGKVKKMAPLYKIKLKKFKKDSKVKIKINGAGRTDTGVHALGQYANFNIKQKIKEKKKLLNSLNFFLSKYSISILQIKEKKIDFHSRLSAKERVYEYHIVNREGSLSLFKNKAWHIKKKLDIKLLKRGAKILEGKHDFSAYRASSCNAKSPIKRINLIKITKKGDRIFILIKSKSFLQKQVRSMVGCLNYLSTKKWSLENFKKVLKMKKRSLCAPPAPAHGLYLKDIKY